MTRQFPSDFLWGAATASYQIEGAAWVEGRGETIWDRFARTPSKVINMDNGDVACDHFNRYRDDVQLMKDLGIKAYRFSVAWARIFPDGYGKVNELGLDFYSRLIDELLDAGITPYCTLYHWDLPQTLQDQGGWVNRDIVGHFTEYTNVISRTLGDRIKHWMTFNEPLCICHLGYYWGAHAPGIIDPTGRSYAHATHNLMLSHGQAVSVLRANDSAAKVGIVLNLSPVHAASNSEADRAAAVRHDGFINRWYADPLFKGSYPTDVLEMLRGSAPTIKAGDMETISTPLDFLGVNYYFRDVVAHDDLSPNLDRARSIRVEGAEFTDMDWEVYADGIREIVERMWRDYQPKAMYITENGCAQPDVIDADGLIHDPRRVEYLRNHLAACHQAIQAGAPLKGYFVWSLMDNYEWAYGYTKRFGITYVDYPTQQRTPKDSFRFYQAAAKANAIE